jgi:hypothetical protein
MTPRRLFTITLVCVTIVAASLWLQMMTTNNYNMPASSMHRRLLGRWPFQIFNILLSVLQQYSDATPSPTVSPSITLPPSKDTSNSTTNNNNSTNSSQFSFGRRGLCVIGCTPYVALDQPSYGYYKYTAMVQEMARTCDIVVHIGDTKPPGTICNRTNLVKSVHVLRAAAKRNHIIALYAPGDNELNDCHRVASSTSNHTSLESIQPADFYRAAEARSYLIQELQLQGDKDLTLQYAVDTHHRFRRKTMVPGSNHAYECAFDKYVELDHYAVATLEVPGSHWYLDDETDSKYPLQDQVDPLKDRFGMYLNAMECAEDWIDQSVTKAVTSHKRALFFTMHAKFYANIGSETVGHPLGTYYNASNFLHHMQDVANRTNVALVYQPLFDKLKQVAKDHADLIIYVVHADGHRFQTLRLNSHLQNDPTAFYSNQNLVAHMVEGLSRALTMWTRFTVDPNSFQPVSVKEEWSREAYYDREPIGHAWIPYGLDPCRSGGGGGRGSISSSSSNPIYNCSGSSWNSSLANTSSF